jgi:hypothetical protein
MTTTLFGVSKTASLELDAQGLRVSRERVAEITVGGTTLRAATLDQEASRATGLRDGLSANDVLAASEELSLSRNAGLASRLSGVIGELGLERVFTASDQTATVDARTQRVSEGMRAAAPAQAAELTPEMQVRGLLRAPFLWEAQMTYQNAATGFSSQAAKTGAAVEARLTEQGNVGLDDESLAMSYGGGGASGYRGDGTNFGWGLGYGYASLSFDPWALTMSRRGTVETGAGDDKLAITRAMQVLAGDGDNVLALVSVREAQAGKGDDAIAANDVGTLDAGDGDNSIEALDAGAILTGGGRDRVTATNANAIDAGAGDDTIDATRVGLVLGGAGNDTISLREATALYRRGDGNDTIRAGADAAVSFADISRDQVDVTRETGEDGRVRAVIVALKDGSGSVRIEPGARGAEDAVLRFADGAELPLAALENSAAQAQATRAAYDTRLDILRTARESDAPARAAQAKALAERAQTVQPELERRALSWLATAVEETDLRGADSLRIVTTASITYRVTTAQRAQQADLQAAARRALDDARRASNDAQRASISIVATPQATWLDVVRQSSTLEVVVRPQAGDTRMTAFFIGDMQGRSGFLFVNRGNDRARALLTEGANGWREPKLWYDDRTQVPWKALMSAVGEMIALQSGAAAAFAGAGSPRTLTAR